MYQPNSIKGMLSMRSEENDANTGSEEVLKEMNESLARMEEWRKKNAQDEEMLQSILNREKPARKQEIAEPVLDLPEKQEIVVNKEALKFEVQPDAFNTDDILKGPAMPVTLESTEGPDMSNRDLSDISYKIAESLARDPQDQTEKPSAPVDVKGQLDDIEKMLAELEAECDGVTLTNDY